MVSTDFSRSLHMMGISKTVRIIEYRQSRIKTWIFDTMLPPLSGKTRTVLLLLEQHAVLDVFHKVISYFLLAIIFIFQYN